MTVQLLHNTPLEPCDIAICKCYGNTPHQDLEKVQNRIDRVANVSKHSSVIEHINYTFDIDGISRACLQELARHRMFSFTVKSSRYTLQELKSASLAIDIGIDNDGEEFIRSFDNKVYDFVILTGNLDTDTAIVSSLKRLQRVIQGKAPNDMAKYCMPEAYRTSLVLTTNARALQNFLELRTSKHALAEIQDLAREMYNQVPDEHKFLFKEYMNE